MLSNDGTQVVIIPVAPVQKFLDKVNNSKTNCYCGKKLNYHLQEDSAIIAIAKLFDVFQSAFFRVSFK